MTRLILILALVLTLFLLIRHNKSSPESARVAAHRLLTSSMTYPDEFTACLEESRVFAKDSLECVFLITSNVSDAYIPQQKMSLTLVRREDRWTLAGQRLVIE